MQTPYVKESQIHQFKNIFSEYIEEKKYDSNILDSKIRLAFEKAKSIFEIEGDPEFKDTILTSLKEICSLRPGRLLVKCLSKTKFMTDGCMIKIIEGEISKYETTHFDDLKNNQVNIDRPSIISMNAKYIHAYNTIDENGKLLCATSKLSIALVHEIIHALHDLNGEFEFKGNYFNNFTELEEQYTITGFKPQKISENRKQNKIDLLCENLFLLSIGSPVRVSHQRAKLRMQENATDVNKNLNAYIEWIKEQIGDFLIPDGMEDNAEYMKNIIKNDNSNFNLASENLRKDHSFVIDMLKNGDIKKLNEDSKIDFVELLKSIVELPLTLEEKIKLLSKINESLFENVEFCKEISVFLDVYSLKFVKIFEGLEIKDCITHKMIEHEQFEELKELKIFMLKMHRIARKGEVGKKFKDFISETSKTLKHDLKLIEYSNGMETTYHPSGMISFSFVG